MSPQEQTTASYACSMRIAMPKVCCGVLCCEVALALPARVREIVKDVRILWSNSSSMTFMISCDSSTACVGNGKSWKWCKLLCTSW